MGEEKNWTEKKKKWENDFNIWRNAKDSAPLLHCEWAHSLKC